MVTKLGFGPAVLWLMLLGPASAEPPTFQVDPAWPKALPNNWIMGQASGVAVDAEDRISIPA